MKYIGIIQARLTSTRLPGKILKPIGDKTLLQTQLKRLEKSNKVGYWIVALPDSKDNDELADYLESIDQPFYRGNEDDVLDRYYKTCQSLDFEVENIVRVCSDNPLLNGDVVDRVIDFFESDEHDYASNSNKEPDYLEDGFDVEVCTFDALESAWKNARLKSQREHVMPYIKDSGNFKCGWKKTCEEYQYKLSVDTQEDLEAIREIFNQLSKNTFTIEDVHKLLQEKPHILEINKESEINSGYKKSLKDDKLIN